MQASTNDFEMELAKEVPMDTTNHDFENQNNAKTNLGYHGIGGIHNVNVTGVNNNDIKIKVEKEISINTLDHDFRDENNIKNSVGSNSNGHI